MSYNPVTDFLSLYRQSSSGVQPVEMPGLDYLLAGLGRANMFQLSVGQTAPTSNQSATLWLQPAQPSWSAEGVVKLWNSVTSQFETATPALWSALLTHSSSTSSSNPPMVFDTIADVQAVTVDASITSVLVVRYGTGHEVAPAVYIPGTSAGPNAFQDASGKFWQLDLTPDLHRASWYGIKGDGGDYHAQLQLAVNFAAGAEVRLPIGTVGISSPVSYITTAIGDQALRLSGAGPGLTTIDNRCAGGPSGCIRAYGSPSAFSYNGFVKNIRFITSTASVVAHLDVLAVYRFTVEDCEFNNSKGNGATITGNLGDADASNIVNFNRCLFSGNAGAGLLHNFANGVAQTSFVRCTDCLFTSNGLCGWYYVGAQGMALNCGFTENGFGVSGQGGLWVANNGAGNPQFTAIDCSWENNYNNNARLDALSGGQFINCEIASNVIAATSGFLLNGSGKITFQGTRVRVTPAHGTYTAFNFQAGSFSNTAENTNFVQYDAALQVRYFEDGTSYSNRFSDSFDAIQNGADNGVGFVTCVNGANPNLALPLDGAGFGIVGPTGAFTIGGFTNPFDGRGLTLLNDSGQTLTLLHEDAGSTAANRIWNGGVNLTVNTASSVALRYFTRQNRWVVSS